MNGARARFEGVRGRRAVQVNRHIRVNNLSLLGSTRFGQMARRDDIDHQAIALGGLGHAIVDHVIRLEHVSGRAVLQELAEVDVVGEVTGLVIQRDQLVARGPGTYRNVVGGINAGTLGVDSTAKNEFKK